MTYFHEEQRFSSLLVGAIGASVALPLGFILVETLIRPGVVVPSLAALLFLWPTRRIPLGSVRRAHVEQYSPLFDYGGWGVRLSPRGWAFTAGGHEGVVVETTEGKRAMIGPRRPRELEAAIARAITERSGR